MRPRPYFSLILCILAVCGCVRLPLEETRHLLGTEVSITVHAVSKGMDRGRVHAVIDSAFTEMKRIEQLAKWQELAWLTANAGEEPVMIGEELVDLIHRSYNVTLLSEGAFRPDLGPLVALWGIGTARERIPRAVEIDSVLALIEETRFTDLENGLARLDPAGASLDLGGVAKGYAVDLACEVLSSKGIEAGIVWAGGDLRCFGRKPDGSDWRIAIRHPRELSEFYTVVDIREGAMATSGDYERYFTVGGQRFHHVFDPALGYPARRSVSATVLAASCADADAYATAMFVAGPARGPELASKQGLPALIVAEDGDSLFAVRNTLFAELEE